MKITTNYHSWKCSIVIRGNEGKMEREGLWERRRDKESESAEEGKSEKWNVKK